MNNNKLNKKKKQDLKSSFTYKKNGNKKLVEYIPEHVSKKMLVRIKNCGDFFSLVADKSMDKKKIYKSTYCGNRFCLICAWIRAKKIGFMIALLMKYIEKFDKKSFIFLTLTAPNVKAGELVDELNKFNLAFKNLMKRKEILPVNKGYVRKLEVTYDNEPVITYDMWHGNPDKHMKPRFEYYEGLGLKIGDVNPNYDTYHPHFHIIMAVNGSYFSNRTYVRQEKWLDLWREVMDDPSITQVFVEKVKTMDAKEKSSKEIAKYAAKESDLLINQEVFDVLYTALKGRQILTYNGLFKEAVKLYKEFQKKKGEEREQDPFYDFIAVDETEYVYFLLYRWGFGEYAEVERRELTGEEKREINYQMVDETEVE